MEKLFSSLVLWLHFHPIWAGLITCFITFLESLAILGLFVPGSVTLSAIGGLIGSGVIPALDIFIWAIVGAILGDGISYWIGYRYHKVIRRIWPISRFPKLITKGEKFFYKHGGKSVFIGRFIGPIRPIVPLVAGMMEVRLKKFFIANIISATLWAPTYMLPGLLVGAASAHFAPHQALHFILILLLIIFGLWLSFWLTKLFTLRIIKHWRQLFTWLWQKLRQQQTWVYTLLYEHAQPLSARPLNIAFFTLCGIVLFFLLLISVDIQTTWLQTINLSILSFFESLYTPILQHLAISSSTYIGETRVILASTCLLGLYFILKRDWHAFWHLVALMLLTVVGVEGSRVLTHSLRPQVTLMPPHRYSFPSGHTASSLALFGYITFLIAHNDKRWFKLTAYGITASIIIIVAISRLYLNVHWLSDIIGSLLLSSCLLGIISIAYRRKERHNRYRALPLLAILMLGQIIFGTWYSHRYAQKLQTKLQLQEAPHYINENQWWASPHSLLPIYRNNRFAKPTQILNVQWAGSLSSIKKTLIQQGWQEPSHFGLHALKQQLLGKKLILFSRSSQLQHHKALLILIKPLTQEEAYLVIRLWDINYHTGMKSIYLGNISHYIPTQNHLWHHKINCKLFYTKELYQLEQDLTAWRYKTITFKHKHRLNNHPCVQENNKIILVRER